MATFEISSEQIEGNDHASIDVENLHFPLADSMRTELDNLRPLSDERCIYRVQKLLRQEDEKAYTPQVVSIGPLHHGREELKAMEEHKKRCLKDFLGRTTVSLERFVRLVKDEESRLRNCYAEFIGLNCDDFVKMILVDAGFIIEVLMRSRHQDFQKKIELIFDKPRMIVDIRLDMCMLENQLPFFILEKVFRLANIGGMPLSFVELAHESFKQLHLCLTEEPLKIPSSRKVKHFVDLLSICHQPSDQPSPTLRPRREFKNLTTPSVKKLHQAGVKFKLASSENLFDIRFNDGILEIPRFEIYGGTETILRNLLAFENSHLHGNYINDFIILMSYLVNTPNDVELLLKKGIIGRRRENSEDVSTLFLKLSKKTRVIQKNFYFFYLMEDLKKYYDTRWHKWKAMLRQNYFNTPWAIISFIAGVILLLFSFIQFVRTTSKW